MAGLAARYLPLFDATGPEAEIRHIGFDARKADVLRIRYAKRNAHVGGQIDGTAHSRPGTRLHHLWCSSRCCRRGRRMGYAASAEPSCAGTGGSRIVVCTCGAVGCCIYEGPINGYFGNPSGAFTSKIGLSETSDTHKGPIGIKGDNGAAGLDLPKDFLEIATDTSLISATGQARRLTILGISAAVGFCSASLSPVLNYHNQVPAALACFAGGRVAAINAGVDRA